MREPSSPTAVTGWDWTEEVWRWQPDREPWRPEMGGPSRCVAIELSTRHLETAEAYDFWRETVFHGFSADRRNGETGAFRADARALISPRAEFAAFRSKGLSGGRTHSGFRSDGNADLTIGFTIAGNRRHSFAEERHLARPGEVYLYDASAPSQVDWDDHQGFYLALRRSDVEAALGEVPASLDRLLAEITASPLLPFLRAQLSLLSRDFGALDLRQKEAVFNGSVELALSLLGGLPTGARADGGARHRRGLMVAAERFIIENLANPRLDAAMIARATGCSRATLYRAFFDHGKTVADQIRIARLLRARHLLEKSPPQVTISEIIAACGLDDPSHFSRMFRRQFGLAPKDVKGVRHGRETEDRSA
ncbi:hypothetical protein GCM10011321_30490 [Youhaiella tibetensis]|uniref:Helix-turn-helix transcriptional regulator n=1 Tax=Paradevosia tibetensis TaxID=1447062 RepID=A0A5B9DKS4_9HYPH|nr:AraC family transcriptional regulator [Youhaiella tibetensis]QEE18978.1 helix-turn-helix transcriptional regulator [Youhaiella tibetensis]GGF37416.1 hypothetical protein GCM10011321_30490 [Youhaiella tibetensis]